MQSKIAEKRIKQLFCFADNQALNGNLSYANNAVRIARSIAMKTTFRIPKQYKHKFCKHCYHYLIPSITCRVRIRKGKRIITCFHCQKQVRYPYKNRLD